MFDPSVLVNPYVVVISLIELYILILIFQTLLERKINNEDKDEDKQRFAKVIGEDEDESVSGDRLSAAYTYTQLPVILDVLLKKNSDKIAIKTGNRFEIECSYLCSM